MLLPEVAQQGYWSDFAIAVDGPPFRILGALAYSPGVHGTGRPGWRVSFRVAWPYRRQGVGSALLRYLVDAAPRCGRQGLQTTHDPQKEPEVTPFLRHKGFREETSLMTYEVGIGPVREFTCSLRDWLAERGELPAGLRYVALREVALPEIVRLHTKYIGGSESGVTAHLQRVLKGPTADDNRVLLVGDEIAGAVLGETVNGVSRVDVTLVTEKYQGKATQSGWAQAVLLAHCLDRAMGLGAQRSEFSCLTTNNPMMRMVTRLKADLKGAREVNTLALEVGQ